MTPWRVASARIRSRAPFCPTGVAGIDAVAEGSVTDLIESADRALYSAKAAGRNRVVRAGSAA